MGLFFNTTSKVAEIESLINLISQRFSEYIEFEGDHPHKVHPSVSQMFGDLYDKLFKLYYPNKQSLDTQTITLKANKLVLKTSSYPIAFFIISIFKTGLSFEENMECKIFKDDTQRAFAKSIYRP
jgi:hypothetical protein